eukprot:3614674-Amphidinium_carterae.3
MDELAEMVTRDELLAELRQSLAVAVEGKPVPSKLNLNFIRWLRSPNENGSMEPLGESPERSSRGNEVPRPSTLNELPPMHLEPQATRASQAQEDPANVDSDTPRTTEENLSVVLEHVQ